MPRKRPIKKIGVYGKYDINPENAVEFYTESKKQNQFYIKKPDWDQAREGLEITAIQHEREYVDYKTQQELMRRDAIVQGKYNEKRINDMYKVQDSVRENFITVNDFIKDCEEKEINATKKTQIEKEIQKATQAEIEMLESDFEILDNFRDVLEKTVHTFKPYEDVIEKVVAESDLFKSVKDLMDRCDALMIAQVEISEMDLEKVKSIENMRQEMVKATNEAALTVMGLNNELADLEKSYNLAQNTSIKWEKVLALTKNYIADNELTTSRLIDSTRHLYKLLTKRNKEENLIDGNDYEGMLDYIKKEMEILNEVVLVSSARIAKEQKSLIVEKGSKLRKGA